MSKLTPSPFDPKSRLGQVIPYVLFGMLVFAGVSSAHLNQFFSVYITLLIAQLGTLSMYLFMRKLKSRKTAGANLKSIRPDRKLS